VGGLSDEERAHWVRLAETTSSWGFHQAVGKAIEDVRQGRPTVRFEAFLTETALRDLRRARTLAEKQARQRLTDGQVLALLARRFVEAEDPQLVGEKRRRVPDTRLCPGDRYVPAQVVRGIGARGEGCCEVGNCGHTLGLQLMHVRRPHAQGGAREIEDLAAGCPTHHVLFDAGLIRFVGFDEWMRPLFRACDGRLIRRDPPATP